MEALVQNLKARSQFALSEWYKAAPIVLAKKGTPKVEQPSGGRSKLMAGAKSASVPVAVHVESASPHEVTLVHDTLKERFLNVKLDLLIGDKAYTSSRPLYFMKKRTTWRST